MNVALRPVEIFVTLITDVGIFETTFGAVLDQYWTAFLGILTSLAVRQCVTRLTFITSKRSWTIQTVVNTNDYFTVLAWVAVLTFWTNSWSLASTFTFIWTYHCTFISKISRLAGFTTICVPSQALFAVLYLTLQTRSFIRAQYITIITSYACFVILGVDQTVTDVNRFNAYTFLWRSWKRIIFFT